MSTGMESLLTSLYKQDLNTGSIEKTAEQKVLDALQEGTNENPFMDMELEDLIKIASEENNSEAAAQHFTSEEEETAMDMLGGEVMAHAMTHEFGLIKEAMAQGLCRVCKEYAMDIDGSSICYACLEE